MLIFGSRPLLSTLATIVLIGLALPSSSESPQTRQSELELRSSDTQLVQAFEWAKKQALAYVFDGDPVGPWYEAALPGRRAFCMRDVSHQAAGAQALGLAEYTRNMLRRFAENISASKDWCSYWEINYLNKAAPVDFINDQKFWYNLPANFDVLDASYRMYLWTRDRSYIDDPAFLNFYDHTVTDYVSRWDLSPDRIMHRAIQEDGPPYFRGDPSYEESQARIILGVDLLAAQYAGYRSYAAIQKLRGKDEAADLYQKRASEIKFLVNTKWWNASGGYFYSFLDKDHKLQGKADADLLYWGVVDDGAKANSAIATLQARMQTEPADAVEPKSHYAEVLYKCGVPDPAYAEIMDLSRPGRVRQEYPEVSFSVIGAIANGLMGVNVESPEGAGDRSAIVVITLPQLSKQTQWAELRNLPVGTGTISIRHEGCKGTVISNQGKEKLIWRAMFPGTFSKLIINGEAHRAESGTLHSSQPITWIQIPLGAGMSASVRVP
jgi:hypothetical protein